MPTAQCKRKLFAVSEWAVDHNLCMAASQKTHIMSLSEGSRLQHDSINGPTGSRCGAAMLAEERARGWSKDTSCPSALHGRARVSVAAALWHWPGRRAQGMAARVPEAAPHLL